MKLQLKFTTEPSVATSGDVKKLQTFLTAFGYDIGPTGADGDFGTRTKGALNEFKLTGRLKNRSLAKADFVSYIAGMRLRLALADVPAFAFMEKSDRVKALQELLADLGYDIGASGADRTFGNDTKTALDNFTNQGAILSPDFHLDILLKFFDGGAGSLPAGDEHFTERVLAIARDQWNFFQNQEIRDFKKNPDGTWKLDSHGDQIPDYLKEGKKETEDGWYQRVGVYWKEGVNDSSLDGTDTGSPWSAAFISYVMRKAGAGNRFLYDPLHSVYIRKAISSKLNQDTSYGFWGYKLNEYAPKVGDLICYTRTPGITYESNSGNYKSHSDIVVAIEGRILKVIGGNVNNSVSLKHLDIDQNGFLIDKKKDWFVVLKNRINVNPAPGPGPIAPGGTPTAGGNPVPGGAAPSGNFELTDDWLKRIVGITGKFESEHSYGGVTGNFDGMGISCGLLQWNIGKESLQPLVKKAGKPLAESYLGGELGGQLWEACNTPVANGLKIVRAWQPDGKHLPAGTTEKLQRLFGSPEMTAIQNDRIREKAKSVVSAYVADWAHLYRNSREITLREFIWFFDLVTLNGGLNGHLGNITFQDAFNFIENKNFDQISDIVSNWVKNYPRTVKDDQGKPIDTYAVKDAMENIGLWRGKLTSANAGLFVLGFLRAQMSKPVFQLLVFNRRGTIAIGEGFVNKTKFKLTLD